MGLRDFYKITGRDDTSGLLWAGEVQEGKYFAEVQTGIIPQLVHLVIFDMEADDEPVYNAVQAFQLGDVFDKSDGATMTLVELAVSEALSVLNA